MKIGILTFSCADNVGAVLQCYALKSYLKNCGHAVEIVNYRPYYLTDSYGIFHNPFEFAGRHGLYHTLTRIRYELCNYRANKAKTMAFREFRQKYLGISSEGGYRSGADLSSLNGRYDALIVGSDQIWGKASDRNSVDTAFLLDFINDRTTRKISYGGSMGQLYGDSQGIFKQYLESFHGISAREKDLTDYLKTILKQKVFQVVDPVFLNDRPCYDKICSEQKTYKEKSIIFVYVLEQNDVIPAFVSKLVNKAGQNVQVVYYSRKKISFPCNAKRLEYLTPEIFLDLIRNADKIVTNSFHGTVYSIIYQKDFYSVPHTKSGSRMSTLLEDLGLPRRLVDEYTEPADKIQWDEVYEKLNSRIDESKEFLRNSLETGRKYGNEHNLF